MQINHGMSGKGRNTHDVGLHSHGAGKGDAPRPVDKKVYGDNFDEITWGPGVTSSRIKTVRKTDNKLIVRYL
jgi:hypothetical protein